LSPSWQRQSYGFGIGISPIVKNLIIINVAIYLLETLFRLNLSHYFGMTPYLFWRGFLWQPITYMFLHGGVMHVVLNMFVLWMFGTPLEWEWGTKKFLTYYFICGIGGGLLSAIVNPSSMIPIVGASGAVMGLLAAFGVMYPNQLIFIYFLFPIRAKYFVIIIGAIELFTAISQPFSSIAHFAHLGGLLFGIVYLKKGDWFRKWRQNSRTKNETKRFHVVIDRNREMERLQKEVDDLLDKINREGLNKLTHQEINRLKEASRKLKEWENSH